MGRQTASTKPRKVSKVQDHTERGHALLSASGASRWLHCTPSARLEEEFGERATTSYAKEGTLAHEIAELYLRLDTLHDITEEVFNARIDEIMADPLFNSEMLDMVPIYAKYCADQLQEAKTTNGLAVMEIEQRLDLTEYVPESFGTADCVVINDQVMEVIDLKYGKGVPVSAEWNTQLMLYGLGALRKYDVIYDISEVRLTIVQPRLDSISTWQISVDDLRKWAEEELKPKAREAFEGKGETSPGAWCRFCAVRNRCRALYKEQTEIARHEFSDPPLLSDEEVADVVLRVPRLVEWANSVAEYAQEKAVTDNKQWPGLKLVEGISRRKWLDEDLAGDTILAKCKELSENDIYTLKLNSITAIEKAVGKKRFNEMFSDIIVRPQGKPTLVPLDDKRPAMGVCQAQIDFAEEI